MATIKIYVVSYIGNSMKYKGFRTTLTATSKRGAVEKFYESYLNYNYFPQEDGTIKDCDGDIIAYPDENEIRFDGGYFTADEDLPI